MSADGRWIRPDSTRWPVIVEPEDADRPVRPAVEEGPATPPADHQRPAWSRRSPAQPVVGVDRPGLRADWLPLLFVLLVQGVLSYRLIGSNTAFLDEGTYIYSGYQEFAHLVHGSPVSTYETFFSGAPVIYPVVVAIGDMLGGLAGARLLSLLFMLSATVAVHLATRRLNGSLAAFLAAALFAALGPTQFLGGYATYDAMALALLAWAAYFAVRLTTGGGYPSMVIAALAVALSVCTKYASLLWAPVVLGIAVLAGRGGAPWAWVRWKRGLLLAVGCVVAIVVPTLLAGSLYTAGFDHTTLMRAPGHDAASYVASEAAKWVGALLVLALVGVVAKLVAVRGRGAAAWSELWLAVVLLVAGLLAPANQIRIHTWLSLQKHVDFGAWFACIVAGAVLAKAVLWLRDRLHLAAGVAIAALVIGPLAWAGFGQAGAMYSAWPNSQPLVEALRPYIHQGSDNYLVEDYDTPAYYLKDSSTWQQWRDLEAIDFKDPATGKQLFGVPAIKAAIAAHHWSVVVLDFAETPDTDRAVQPALKQAGYRAAATVVSDKNRTQGRYTIYLAPGYGG